MKDRLTDPTRISDDPTGGDLAEAVRLAQSREPSEERLARVAAALNFGGPPSGPPPAPPAPKGGGLSSGAAIAMGTGVAALMVVSVGLYVSVSSESPEPSAPEPTAVEAETPVPYQAIPVAEPPIEPAPAPEPATARRTPDRVEPPAIPEPPPPATDSPAASLREEAALIHQAERALAEDPLEALRLANAHRRRFGRTGAMAQEREVIAIDALLRLDQRRGAEARAHSFETLYGESFHTRRIRRMLAAP